MSDSSKAAENKPQRVAKIIARSGVCSRRDAESLIEQGRVKLNGKVLESPAVNVDPAKDEVLVDDKPISKPQAPRLFIYHKPVGLVTTHKDEKGRLTVFDKLPEGLPRLVSVGRLDLNSEGLLLLTNDGEISRKLELPINQYKRVYKVRVFGKLPDFSKLPKQLDVDGVIYKNVQVQVEKQGNNSWLLVTLHEGKNREIRKIMAHYGLEVSRLIRVSYAGYELGDLPPGELKEVPCEL